MTEAGYDKIYETAKRGGKYAVVGGRENRPCRRSGVRKVWPED
jgi:hypothetical protein